MDHLRGGNRARTSPVCLTLEQATTNIVFTDERAAIRAIGT
jgi:hypothetical protein